MTRDTKTRLMVSAVAMVVILAAARTVNHYDETPFDRAYLCCGECGFDHAWVDQIVDDVTHSTLDRDGLIQLFDATFGPEDDKVGSPTQMGLFEATGK